MNKNNDNNKYPPSPYVNEASGTWDYNAKNANLYQKDCLLKAWPYLYMRIHLLHILDNSCKRNCPWCWCSGRIHHKDEIYTRSRQAFRTPSHRSHHYSGTVIRGKHHFDTFYLWLEDSCLLGHKIQVDSITVDNQNQLVPIFPSGLHGLMFIIGQAGYWCQKNLTLEHNRIEAIYLSIGSTY